MGRRSSQDDEPRYSPAFARALGREIKVMRTDLGLERRELAERAGISYSYLTEIESGNKPPSSVVLGELAGALGLRMSQLIEAAETRMETQTSAPTALFSTAEWAREFGVDPDARATAPAAREMLAAEPPRAQYQSHRPSLRRSLPQAPNRDLRGTMIEFERLLRTMAPEDIDRLLDFARRLARS